jgi:uncharacterized protein (TIGR02266 family)
LQKDFTELAEMGESGNIGFWAIICFFGFIVAWAAYSFLKFRQPSELHYFPSVGLAKKAGKEIRQHPRAEINWRVSIETPGGTITATVINISLGGAFICCEKPFAAGEVFDLTMTGPDNEPLIATAKVVWSNMNVPDEKVVNRGMGVRFMKMSDRHLQLVKQISHESD